MRNIRYRFFNETSNCFVIENLLAKWITLSTREKDKNGQEIFEGDILKTDEAGWIATVIFNKAAFILVDSFGGFSARPNWEKCEIIGDIFQNPNLLQSSNDLNFWLQNKYHEVEERQ